MQKKQNLMRSFYHAFKGLQYFFLHDRNGKIHLTATIAVIALSFVLKLSGMEWMIMLLCIALVMALEMVNAAMEKLCDRVKPDLDPAIKIIKDVSAAAVLWASIISAMIGCIVFIPKIIEFLS